VDFLGRMSILGPLIPRKEECPWSSWVMFFREKLCLAYTVVCLWEFLMRWDMCLDPSVSQKLITTDAPFASSFSKLEGERVEHTDLALARKVEALLIL